MSTSLVYRTALGYEMLMLALYGRHYTTRLDAVCERVPRGSTVLELCCGPGALYRRCLRERCGGYTALELNDRFVARLRRAGVDARAADLTSDSEPLPVADIVLMQASLYHFLPDPTSILERMVAAARHRVIIAEPIRNLTSSRLAPIAWLGARAADPGRGGHASRFTETTLDQLMDRYATCVSERFVIPGGREKLYVLAAG